MPRRRRPGVRPLSRSESLALMAIAYYQPIARAELSEFFGKEVSRDLIGGAPRHGPHRRGAAQPAPGRALRLRDDEEFSGAVRLREPARSARHRDAGGRRPARQGQAPGRERFRAGSPRRAPPTKPTTGPTRCPNPVGFEPLSTRLLLDVSRSARPRELRLAGDEPGLADPHRRRHSEPRPCFGCGNWSAAKKPPKLNFLSKIEVLNQKSGPDSIPT